MFARVGRDVDAELAAQAAAEARGDKAFKRTIYACPRQFADPEAAVAAAAAAGEDVDWFFDQTAPGVVTALLTDLLDMRAAVRTAQKAVKYGSGEWLCFEGQQLACKLIANSTYGATGATVGRLALMVISATVTGEGKVTIKNVHDQLLERYPNAVVRTFCAGGDSVTGDTPLLLRHVASKTRHLITVEELERYFDDDDCANGGAWVAYGAEKEQIVLTAGSWEVWSDTGFTPIRRVIRHKTAKRIVRVLTHTGLVDVTEDHSLLDEAGKRIKPNECKVGTRLMHAYPVAFEARPEVYAAFDVRPRDASEAWLWGLFLADGSCGSYDCPSGKKSSWAISKRDRVLLARAATALQLAEPHLVAKVLETEASSGALKLVPLSGAGDKTQGYGAIVNLVTKYRELFYNDEKLKQVPQCILNAPLPIRTAFFEGYYAGDGDKESGQTRCDIKGKIGAAGLFYLQRSLGYTVALNTRLDKPEITRLNTTRGAPPRNDPAAIKKIHDTTGTGDRYVYDLETETHHFHAGVGDLIVHNTDSVFFGVGHLATTEDVGRWVCEVEAFCNTLVEKPMRIEFEKEFENGYLALAKKRYAFNNIGFKSAYWTPFDDEDEEMCERINAHAAACGRPPPFDIALERTRKWKRLRMDPVSQLKARGMETVRRDSCEYVRETLGRVLALVVEQRSPERALEYARAQAQALLLGRVPLHKLVMSKHYSKTDYATRSLPHLTIIDKCERRGAEVPELGSRISFLITRGAKGEKAFQCAETVEYVLENELPIDYEYYLENQLVKPVLRILDWVCGFSAQRDAKKRYATALSVKPLLVVDTLGGSGAAAPSTLRAMLGAPALAPRPPRYVHVVEVPAGAGGAEARGALGALAARVEAAKPRQFFVTTQDGAEALPADLRDLVERGVVALVATKRVWRENGVVYTSIAHGRAFTGFARAAATAAPRAAVGIMQYARVTRPCIVPGCLAQTHAEMCDACLSERPAAVHAALDAMVATAAEQYEETLPVCRRCSGNYDTATEIECANADCEHFYPRRVAEHKKRRCERRRADAVAEMAAVAGGAQRKRVRALADAM